MGWHRAGGDAADIGVVASGGDEEKRLWAVWSIVGSAVRNVVFNKNGGDGGDVGQVGAAVVGIVGDVSVSGVEGWD